VDRRLVIFRWAFFTVLLSVLPVLFTGITFVVLGHSLSDWSLLGHGDLLVVTTVVAATAIGDLLVLLRPVGALRRLSTQMQLASAILVIAPSATRDV
jgi:hypothetical protein